MSPSQTEKFVTIKKIKLPLIPVTVRLRIFILFCIVLPKKERIKIQPYTAYIWEWNPKIKSLKNIALIGIRKTVFLLGKHAPPKIASAKIGVKLGRCGTSLVKDTRKITNAINNNLEYICSETLAKALSFTEDSSFEGETIDLIDTLTASVKIIKIRNHG